MANQQTIPTEVIVFVLGLGCSLIPWLWEKGGGVMSRLTALLFLTVAVAMVWWSLTRLGWPELVPLGKRTTTYSGAALTGIALVVVGRLWIPFMFPPKEDVVPRPTRTRLQFNAIDTYPTVIDMSESGAMEVAMKVRASTGEIDLTSSEGRGLVAVEERKARRGLYPVTVLYSSYSGCVLAAALSVHVALALSFFVIGIAVFTIVEYLVHRYILHGRFPDGKGWMKHVLHGVLNRQKGIAGPAGHAEHHKRPWDGNHINGHVDTVPLAVILALLSFAAPLYTAPALIAGILLGYLVEEWIHHAVHFCTFKSTYFEYIRRHHLYHHAPKGSEVAYGLTTGFWDTVYRTRIPEADRRLLYGQLRNGHGCASARERFQG